MATDDHQPPPLSRDDVLRIVDAVRQRAVLVGGQAVAWWAEFYGAQGRLQTVKQATDLYVSRDADFVPGSLWRDDVRALVSDVASQLRGTATYRFAFNSLLVGSITYRDNDGLDRAVEFLRNLHGVEKQESVLDNAIHFESDDLPAIVVMDPVTLLGSRIANVVDLAKYQTPRGLLQAHVAAEVLREWHMDQLSSSWTDARGDIEQTMKLAESKRGIAAAAHFDIDILGTIPADHPALPGPFVAQRYRRCRKALQRSIEAAHASSSADTDE